MSPNKPHNETRQEGGWQKKKKIVDPKWQEWLHAVGSVWTTKYHFELNGG